MFYLVWKFSNFVMYKKNVCSYSSEVNEDNHCSCVLTGKCALKHFEEMGRFFDKLPNEGREQ